MRDKVTHKGNPKVEHSGYLIVSVGTHFCYYEDTRHLSRPLDTLVVTWTQEVKVKAN